ncbi:type IV toxin-antitoxin system AbiEi family antitoxin domain-containing protein [Arthrobacter antioxidans]|uniref:type IV toxin-antitoxin system AbiEi family antitoxin domain-containing protein n=1 Tax=Arthrobacter antioxidans TaxID=2895818 RepID=UPI003AEF7CD1
MDVLTALAATGGVGRARDLVRMGVPGGQITRALGGGLIVRVSRGAYALPEHDGGALTAVGAGADLACISAAQQRVCGC